MWASHFVGNGNKLSISSWLATECGQPAGMWADRILGPRTLFFFYFLQFLVKLQFYVTTDNRNRNRGYPFQHNRIRTATAVFKNTTTEARTATAVF